VTILVVASRNRGKIGEIQRLLDSEKLKVEIKSVADFKLPDVEETGDSFEANALLKARTIASATGFPAIADDSGLAVDALGGAPGIYSARWSGAHGDDRANIEKLLKDLVNVSAEMRSGRFIAVVVIALPNGESISARGELPGMIRFEASGVNGFGYDPIFEPIGESRTLAQMAPEEKDAISHRARALHELAPKIAAFLNR
jgi:XTP/dITP diphosphohydrolase